jgi:hypothetical protein
MKKLIALVLISLLVVSISSCANGTTNSPGGTNNTVEANAGGENSDNSATKKVVGKFIEEEVISKLDVKTYQYTNSIKTSWIFLVIKNNSEFDLNVGVNLTMKDANGNLIGAKSDEQEAFQSGTEIVLSFMNDDKPDKIEYEITAEEEDYFECVVKDLAVETTLANNKAIVTVKNNGSKPAEFVEGTALFFLGDKLVNHDSSYFVDNENEIKPGKSITKELTSYQKFDSVKVYFTGRR